MNGGAASLPHAEAPASAEFFRWTGRYLAAPPAGRAGLIEEGMRLAQARRGEFRELIMTDPRRALAEAVPMVARQQLPEEIVDLLEKRVNRRAAVTVYQGSPLPGEPLPARSLTHRIAQVPGEGAFNLHVYGRRAESVLNVPNAAINGVGIDREIAASEEPLRVLEVGEIPTSTKPKVTICPVSGKTSASSESTLEPVAAAQAEAVVETPEEIVYLCGGYHRAAYAQQLIYGEGATGGPTTISGPLPAAPTPALGTLKVLFIPMTFRDTNAVPATESTCYQVMRDVADYYLKSSFGKLTTLTTVTPPVKLPKDEAWYVQRDTSNGGDIDGLGLEMSHAREEARRLGFDYNDYDCTVLRLSGGARPTGGWGGGSTVWIYGDSVGVTAHEIGHSFGLAHANFWDTAGTSAIGPGANAEYGDSYDNMGGGGVPTDHYNVAAKVQVKWLPDNYVQNVTSSGLYRLYAFDQPILDPRNRYALTIVKDAQRTYWGELRQNYNGNASRPWADKGMLLGWKFPAGGGGNIQLIDTTPGSPFGKDDAAIALGSTFGDTEAGIFITTVAVSSTTPKYVDVVVNLGAFEGNQPPTLALVASGSVVPVGTAVTFTATASDPEGDALAYQWQHWGDSGTRIVSPNSPMITRTFSTAGSYVVSCTVSDMKGGTVTRERLIIVGNGGGRFTVSGRITDNGVGLPNVLVNANNTNPVITDADGYYTITNLTANTYTMTPLLYGYSFGELFNNSVTVGPNFVGADFEATALPRVAISAPDAIARENSGTDKATLRITRTGDISQPLVVNVSTAQGTAGTSDYTLLPALTSGSPFGSFTIPAESATLDIVVTGTNDATLEGPETLTLPLAAGAGYLIGAGGGSATVTIDDDDTTLPKVSIVAVTDTTIENSSAPGRFSVSRTGATGAALIVNFTVSGTASGGSDYVAPGSSVTIPAQAASALIDIATLDDALVESLESVRVTLSSNPVSYVLNPSATAATVNVIDDDTALVTVTAADPVAREVDLSQPDAVADTGTFLITRSGDTSEPLTVYYSIAGTTSGVPALNGVDFEALAGVVQIPPGSAAASVTIVPRWDDLGETTEQVVLQLGAGPTSYQLGSSHSAMVQIHDGTTGNAPYVELINVSSAAEPGTTGRFRFSLKGTAAGNVAVNFALTGTATVTDDYTVTLPTTPTGSSFDAATGTGTVMITGTGTNFVEVTITPVNDASFEDVETVVCEVTAAAAYQTFGPTASAAMWLRDNEQPTVWADAQVGTGSATNRLAEGSSVSPVKFYVSRTGATTSALPVNFKLAGSATAGTDYTVTTGAALTFDPGTSTGVLTIPEGVQGADVTLSIAATNDTLAEGTETIELGLDAGAYSRGLGATIYLDDNDSNPQTVAFAAIGSAGAEDVANVSIPVTLLSPATAKTTVDYVLDTGTRASSSNTGASTPPYWVRVARNGSSFTTLTSTDGVIWRQLGTAQTISMSSVSYTAGIVAASSSSGSTTTAVIDSVSVTGLEATGTVGAMNQTTIGTSNPASSSSELAGTHTIVAGGTDLAQSGTSGDVCRYVSFPISNSITCTITARVASISGGPTAAKAGAMIRETTGATSRHLAAMAQRDGAVRQVSRLSTNAATTSTSVLRPYWVKVERTGSVFRAFGSPDGSTWTQVGTDQTLSFGQTLLAGLAVSARSDGTLSTATFDNVMISSAPALSLLGRTVGYVNAQGTNSLDAGLYTVGGSGAAIGGVEDECHFVAMPVTGDFAITARVVSQSGGAVNAQAGVMLRDVASYRSRSVYCGMVANAAMEFITRNSTVTTAYGAGVDFDLPGGTLTFEIGEQSKDIPLTIIDDSLPEPTESLTVILRNPNGAQLGANAAYSYTIDDNDALSALPLLAFAAGTSSVVESAGSAILQVSLSDPAVTNVNVDYAVTAATATDGVDYTLAAGTLVFAPGELVKGIAAQVFDDALLETISETVEVTLSNAVGASLGAQAIHTLTITDDDLPVVSIVANDATATEAAGDGGQFTVSRTGSTTGDLVVNFAIATGTGRATAGTDFTSIGTSVTIPDGQVSVVINVLPIQDATNEGSETLQLTLSAQAAAYSVGTPAVATVTIADDDRSTVTIVANDPAASETAGNPGQFTITRTAPTTGSLTVNLTITGTAANTTDYTTVASTVSFSAGQISRAVNITPVNDSTTEGDELVVVQLGSGSYTVVGNGYDSVTISDNDLPPIVYVTSPTAQAPLVASGQGIIVSALVTDDGTPQPVTQTWTQVSGPGTANFETPTLATTAVGFTADGVYVLRVTATDGQFTVNDQVTVIVGAAITPADWVSQDLSPSTQQRGQSAKIGEGHVLTGMGAGYAAVTNDAAHVMARQVAGDGSVVVRLTALSGNASAPLAGVTIRDSLARASNRAVLGYVPGVGLQFRVRTTAGATDSVTTQGGITLPVWLKLERTAAGNAITASYASDAGGAPGSWTTIGAGPTTVTMVNDLTQMGLTATGNNSAAGVSCTATFDNVTLTPVPSGPAIVTEDFGTGTPTPGTFAVNGGTYTIGGSGGMDGSGAFYGWQYHGDLMITAKLASATSTALSAKSGIMIRESMDSTAGYIHVGRIPQGAFSGYIWRSLANGSGGGVPSFTGAVRWMRLVRQGNRVTAFHAADVAGNPGAWTQLGQPQTIIMSTPVLVGFAVDNSGGSAGVLNVCTFTNLSIVQLNKAPIVDPGTVAAYSLSPIELNGTVTDDNFPAPPSVSSLWTRRAGAGAVVFESAASVDTSLSLAAAGAYTLRLQASDGSVETFRDLSFTGYLTTFDVWRGQQWAATGGLADPSSAPGADPDYDGIENFLEYAHGTSPLLRNSNPVVIDRATVGTDQFLRLNVAKNPVAPELQFQVLGGDDLQNPGAWTADGLIIEEDTATSLRVRDHIPLGSTPGRYLRLKVAEP